MISKSVPSPILPGATIGVLGSGQLGRMLALAARAMGYRVHVYSPDSDTPAGQVADQEFVGAYEDLDAIRAFARSVQVVTFEFENVASISTSAAAECVPVRPDGFVLHTTQNRLREKTFLASNGFPVTGFRRVNSIDDLSAAVKELGLPAVLKTADFGYDGKGQIKITAVDQIAAAWQAMKGAESIFEAFVPFQKELSVVGARTLSGEFATFPVFENAHANHILDVTFAPADIDARIAREAADLAAGILQKLDVIGLLTVEMFLTKEGKLLVNELAPRTHNSGHLTIDACATSQFEQQVRAVCGLPLGSTAMTQPAAMANLLGNVWSQGEPRWTEALSDPAIKMHLYGKAQPRIGRKMGHLTASAPTVAEAVKKVVEARAKLSASSRHLI